MGKSNRTRIRRSAQEWKKILARCERGGQRHREFCKREGLALSTFQWWRRKLEAVRRERETPETAWFVELSDEGADTEGLVSDARVGDQHHQDRAVANVGRAVTFGGCEQTQDLVPVQPLRDRLTAIEPRWQDSLGQARCAPALLFSEPEEAPKALCVIVDRDPAVAVGVVARNRPVDVAAPDRSQCDAPLVEPVEETIDRMAATTDRVLRPSALIAHLRREERDLASMSVLPCVGFLKQAQETQPPHCAAEKSLACIRARRAPGMTPAGLRPLPGRSLHPSHADTLGCA